MNRLKRPRDFMRMRDDDFPEVPEGLKPKEIDMKLSGLKNPLTVDI